MRVLDSLLLHDTSNKIACDGCDRGLGCHLRAYKCVSTAQAAVKQSMRAPRTWVLLVQWLLHHHPRHHQPACVFVCQFQPRSAASSLGRASPPSSTGASVLDGTAAVAAGGAGGAPAPHVGHPPGIAGAAFPCIACDSSLMIANASSSCASFSASFCLRPSYVGRPVSLTCSGSETQTGPLSASAGGLTLPNQRVWTAPAWVLTRTTAGGQA